MDQEQQKYVRALLSNDIKPANHYVQTLVDQLRDAERGITELAPQLEQATAHLEQLRQTRIGLIAVAQQSMRTLLGWRGNSIELAAED